MPTVSVALASINPTVGDLAGNTELIIAAAVDSVAAGARLIAFPEMALTGYPVEDLALRPSFRTASRAALDQLTKALHEAGCAGATIVVGYLGESAPPSGDRDLIRPTNSAAVIRDGNVVARYDKHRLPNYGVFDEERWFAAGDDPCVFDVDGLSVSLAICEDLWQGDGPALRAARHTDLLLVINASPFEVGKSDTREQLCRRRADELKTTVAYVNLVGGQDELVFDGGSIVVDVGGATLLRSTRFRPELAVIDLPTDSHRDESPAVSMTTSPGPLRTSELADCYDALVLGLHDYVIKNAQRTVLLGLSGGIDSALVAVLACDAFGPENVFAVAMPSRYSSQHSLSDAADLAERTGLRLRTVAIESMFAAFQSELALSGLAEENLQARIRGAILMALSNAEGHLVLATGNKSEIAVGYSTIYGDAVGGFAPIKDVPKTLVWELARHRNALASTQGQTPPIPNNCITKAPSAELRPGQLDADSLPDYAVLDAILAAYIERRCGAAELVRLGFDQEVVRRVLSLTDRAEYKRRQYPPGPKITTLAFGRDRRLPITNRWTDPLD